MNAQIREDSTRFDALSGKKRLNHEVTKITKRSHSIQTSSPQHAIWIEGWRPNQNDEPRSHEDHEAIPKILNRVLPSTHWDVRIEINRFVLFVTSWLTLFLQKRAALKTSK